MMWFHVCIGGSNSWQNTYTEQNASVKLKPNVHSPFLQIALANYLREEDTLRWAFRGGTVTLGQLSCGQARNSR